MLDANDLFSALDALDGGDHPGVVEGTTSIRALRRQASGMLLRDGGGAEAPLAPRSRLSLVVASSAAGGDDSALV